MMLEARECHQEQVTTEQKHRQQQHSSYKSLLHLGKKLSSQYEIIDDALLDEMCCTVTSPLQQKWFNQSLQVRWPTLPDCVSVTLFVGKDKYMAP